MCSQCTLSLPPETIRKPQGVQWVENVCMGTNGLKQFPSHLNKKKCCRIHISPLKSYLLSAAVVTVIPTMSEIIDSFSLMKLPAIFTSK